MNAQAATYAPGRDRVTFAVLLKYRVVYAYHNWSLLLNRLRHSNLVVHALEFRIRPAESPFNHGRPQQGSWQPCR